MITFQIREAIPEDMPQVLERIQELAIFEKAPQAVVIAVEDLIESGFSENPLFTCFVAADRTDILGIALVYFRFSTWKGKTLHLEDLIVQENKRGIGIGTALYERVMQYAKAEKVKRVEWNVLDWNTPAIEFYKKTGAKILSDWRVVQMDAHGILDFIEKQSTRNM